MEELVSKSAFALSEEIMKAKLRAKLLEVEKNIIVEHGKADHHGMTRIKFSSGGKVETTLNTNAQLVFLNGDLFLKEVIADQIKLGANITIIISDEETE